jgi:KDO2-lipid IV(A) lauroyltransferase
MVESVKSFTISKKQLAKRFIIKNPELADSYAKKDQSIIIVGGHYNNWEMFAQATPLYHEHN